MPSFETLTDKVAVITGGASGIGLATAERFLSEGMKVVIADISENALTAASESLNAGDRLYTTLCDVSTMDANVTLARETIDVFGGVNVVYLNAGTLGSVEGWRATEITERAWRHTLSVSLDGPFYGQRAFMPYLEKETDARLIFTSSAFGLMTGLGDPAPYYVSKAGLLSFAEVLYWDLTGRDSHIGVTCVLPGNTQTGPYHQLVAELARTESNPDAWDDTTWGSRDYVQGLIDYFTTAGTPPDVIVDAIVDALLTDKFYVVANVGRFWDHIDHRIEAIRAGENPTYFEKTPDVYKEPEN